MQRGRDNAKLQLGIIYLSSIFCCCIRLPLAIYSVSVSNFELLGSLAGKVWLFLLGRMFLSVAKTRYNTRINCAMFMIRDSKYVTFEEAIKQLWSAYPRCTELARDAKSTPSEQARVSE